MCEDRDIDQIDGLRHRELLTVTTGRERCCLGSHGGDDDDDDDGPHRTCPRSLFPRLELSPSSVPTPDDDDDEDEAFAR